MYVPGADAQVVRVVSMRPGQAAQPLPVPADIFQRFDLSRDRRWLAAVVLGAQGQELRVYNLRDGDKLHLAARAHHSARAWNPAGHSAARVHGDSTCSFIVYGSPASAMGAGQTPPRARRLSALLSSSRDDFADEHPPLGAEYAATRGAMRFDPTVRPIRFDSLAYEPSFMTRSPSGKLGAPSGSRGADHGDVVLPEKPERIQTAAQGVEPLWLSETEIVKIARGCRGVSVEVDATTGELVGTPTLWARDPGSPTLPGWSNRCWGRGMIYVQGPE